MDNDFSRHSIFPFWLGAVLGVIAFGAYVTCFVFAARTGKLKTLDYVAGSAGICCGLGWTYFLMRANTVTLQRSFDLINEGGDPAVSRTLNKRFKIAGGIAILSGILAIVVSR